VPDEEIERALRKVFDLRPRAIIEALKLLSPIYRPTAAYGHFGRAPYRQRVDGTDYDFFTWERTDRVDELRAAAGI
jgi:S-adenosylmethionine synthetase